jgi:hypothetical protein
MPETPSLEVEAFLSALKPLADAGALTAEEVAGAAAHDVTLLMRAAAEADARSRAAVGTSDFHSWSDVAVVCARAVTADRL